MTSPPMFTQVLFGLAFTGLAGLVVGPLVRWSGNRLPLPPPSSALAHKWARVVAVNEGGFVLGNLERIVFFGAFWGGLEFVIGGYLALKVTSKWNAWTNVVAVPKELPGLDPLEYLVARRSWASNVLVTFLVGTLANVIVAYVSVLAGRYGVPLLCAALC